ncbi:MAG: CPBP family intramembrane glutamic endopeptidase [Anaerolineales bacterium]
MLPTFIVIYLLNALPEEYGWRGYALGPMLTRFNALTASLILGLIWGSWHLPLHFIEGTVQYGIPVYQFFLQQLLLAIFYTWLFKNTFGNVFVTILFHAIGNLTGATIPYWTTDQGRWINFGFLLIISLVILLIFRAKNLSRTATPQVE